MQIDDIFREIGEFGAFQISLYCLLGMIGIPSGKNIFCLRGRKEEESLIFPLSCFKVSDWYHN